jgi:hypothetical protein
LKKLHTGSEAYDHAYSDAMQPIEGQLADEVELAKETVSWITCAKRPFTKLELQHALAIEIDQTEFDKDNIPDMDDIVSVCAGLVTVDQESGNVRLVHYTTQEYFERMQQRWFPTAELNITAICVIYISFTLFESGICSKDLDYEQRLLFNPLYEYAANYWGDHACQTSSIHPKVLEFLQCTTQVEAAAQVMLFGKCSYWDIVHGGMITEKMSGIHFAAYIGATEVLTALLHRVPIDLKSSSNR